MPDQMRDSRLTDNRFVIVVLAGFVVVGPR